MPDYSKVGDGPNKPGPNKPSLPRPTPAQLAKRQSEVNQERLKAAAQQQAREMTAASPAPSPTPKVVTAQETKGKRTKDEREREFIMSVEMVLGHPLFEWQKEWLKEIRKASFEGKKLNITIEDVRRRRGY